MTQVRVGINGFGRIGRLACRILSQYDNVEIVGINDLTDAKTLAHLFKYDTAHRQFKGEVSLNGDSLNINGKDIKVFAERDPAALPWGEFGADIVIESTGVFRDVNGAGKHLTAGAKKVVISAPAKGDVKTIVLGVNDDKLEASDTILSNASCTTNCLAPMVKVLDAELGIVSGLMTTIHAYTSDQRLQDAPHSDLRRARAAALNIVPTSTGAAEAVGKVLPQIKGKLTGGAVRVPTITGSMTELNCIVNKEAGKDEINAMFKAAAGSHLKGILQYSEEPLVSMDIVGNSHSTIYDAPLTMVMGNLVRVVGWYDNEYGYASRISDLVRKIAAL